ncbi:MAG: SWIM zinc finger family protein [Alkalibacterium sp.]|nr:SWIM zinc finger family protein [Alkalibacterium sp.]
MKLSNFERIIDSVILERGENYYLKRAVESVNQGNDGHYLFKVTGSKNYNVLLDLDRDEDTINYIDCDCPYNQGPYCKHMAAALYHLSEKNLDTEKTETPEPNQTMLNQLDKAELIQIVTDLLERYPVERHKVFFKYSHNTGSSVEFAFFKQKIDEVISSYSHPYDIIGYYETMELTDELVDILEVISEVRDESLAFESLLYLHKKTAKLTEQSDDSAGSIGGLFKGIEDELSHRLSQPGLDTQTQLSLLKQVEKTTNSKLYEGWESLVIDLLSVFKPATKDKQVRAAFLRILDKKLKKLNQESEPYTVSELLKLKGFVIKSYGSDKAYKDFLYAHEADSQIRKELLEYLLKKQAYKEVLDKLVLSHTIEPYWARRDELRYAYQAYEGLNELDNQIETGKELILANDFEYYNKLKAIAPDPKALYEDMKNSIKELQTYQSFDLYKKLIIAEKDTDAILQLTENNPHLIEMTLNLLKETYPEETLQIYTNYMFQLAEKSSNRKEYKQFCKKLTTYGKIFGEEKKRDVISQLEETYKHRPAMIDELSKIK